MKSLILSSLVLSSLLTGSFTTTPTITKANKWWPNIPESPENVAWEGFTGHSFYIEYPSDWEVHNSSALHGLVQYELVFLFGDGVGASILAQEADGSLGDELLRLAKHYRSFKTIEKITVAKTDGVSFEYTRLISNEREGVGPYHKSGRQILLVKDKKIYTIDFWIDGSVFYSSYPSMEFPFYYEKLDLTYKCANYTYFEPMIESFSFEKQEEK